MPFGSTYNPEQAQQVDQVASEAKARELNQKQDYSFQSCEALLELTELRNTNKSRTLLNEPKAEYLTLGMYSHGNFYGITNNTLQRPNLVRYLNNFARKHLPREAQWTSITLSRNNQLPVHKDNHNHPRYQNYGIGLGEYTGGELAGSATPHRTIAEHHATGSPQRIPAVGRDQGHSSQGGDFRSKGVALHMSMAREPDHDDVFCESGLGSGERGG